MTAYNRHCLKQTNRYVRITVPLPRFLFLVCLKFLLVLHFRQSRPMNM